MVKLNSQHGAEPDAGAMDRTFAALSDPTRRAILARLAEDDGVRVTELAAPFTGADSGVPGAGVPGAGAPGGRVPGGAMSLPAVSKHLRVLERAGLLKQEKDGRVRRCHLQPEPLKAAHDWVERYRVFWSGQLDALAEFLERAPGSEADQPSDPEPGDPR